MSDKQSTAIPPRFGSAGVSDRDLFGLSEKIIILTDYTSSFDDQYDQSPPPSYPSSLSTVAEIDHAKHGSLPMPTQESSRFSDDISLGVGSQFFPHSKPNPGDNHGNRLEYAGLLASFQLSSGWNPIIVDPAINPGSSVFGEFPSEWTSIAESLAFDGDDRNFLDSKDPLSFDSQKASCDSFRTMYIARALRSHHTEQNGHLRVVCGQIFVLIATAASSDILAVDLESGRMGLVPRSILVIFRKTSKDFTSLMPEAVLESCCKSPSSQHDDSGYASQSAVSCEMVQQENTPMKPSSVFSALKSGLQVTRSEALLRWLNHVSKLKPRIASGEDPWNILPLRSGYSAGSNLLELSTGRLSKLLGKSLELPRGSPKVLRSLNAVASHKILSYPQTFSTLPPGIQSAILAPIKPERSDLSHAMRYRSHDSNASTSGESLSFELDGETCKIRNISLEDPPLCEIKRTDTFESFIDGILSSPLLRDFAAACLLSIAEKYGVNLSRVPISGLPKSASDQGTRPEEGDTPTSSSSRLSEIHGKSNSGSASQSSFQKGRKRSLFFRSSGETAGGGDDDDSAKAKRDKKMHHPEEVHTWLRCPKHAGSPEACSSWKCRFNGFRDISHLKRTHLKNPQLHGYTTEQLRTTRGRSEADQWWQMFRSLNPGWEDRNPGRSLPSPFLQAGNDDAFRQAFEVSWPHFSSRFLGPGILLPDHHMTPANVRNGERARDLGLAPAPIPQFSEAVTVSEEGSHAHADHRDPLSQFPTGFGAHETTLSPIHEEPIPQHRHHHDETRTFRSSHVPRDSNFSDIPRVTFRTSNRYSQPTQQNYSLPNEQIASDSMTGADWLGNLWSSFPGVDDVPLSAENPRRRDNASNRLASEDTYTELSSPNMPAMVPATPSMPAPYAVPATTTQMPTYSPVDSVLANPARNTDQATTINPAQLASQSGAGSTEDFPGNSTDTLTENDYFLDTACVCTTHDPNCNYNREFGKSLICICLDCFERFPSTNDTKLVQ